MHSGDEDCMITYSKREAKRFAELNDGYIIEKLDKDGRVVYYVVYYIDRQLNILLNNGAAEMPLFFLE